MPGMRRRIAATSCVMNVRSVLLLLVVLGVSACSTVAPGQRPETPVLRGISADTEVREYEIRGYSARELRAQMNRLGPKDWSDARYAALTGWDVYWFIQFDRQTEVCGVESVTATLSVTMDLPRWANAESGTGSMKRRWQVFLDQLVWHENIHREYGVRAAAEIEKQLAKLPAMDTCEALEQVANETGNAVVRKFHKQSTHYDVTTKHGATQGAWLP